MLTPYDGSSSVQSSADLSSYSASAPLAPLQYQNHSAATPLTYSELDVVHVHPSHQRQHHYQQHQPHSQQQQQQQQYSGLSTVPLSARDAHLSDDPSLMPFPVLLTGGGSASPPLAVNAHARSCMVKCCVKMIRFVRCRTGYFRRSCCRKCPTFATRSSAPSSTQYIQAESAVEFDETVAPDAPSKTSSSSSSWSLAPESKYFKRRVGALLIMVATLIGLGLIGRFVALPAINSYIMDKPAHNHDLYRKYTPLEMDGSDMLNNAQAIDNYLALNDREHCASSVEVRGYMQHVVMRSDSKATQYYKRSATERFWHFVNPIIEFSNFTADGHPVVVDKLHSVLRPSHCNNNPNNKPPGFNTARQVVEQDSHVIIKFYDLVDKTYKRISVFDDYALCLQHYNDIFNDKWTCSPHDHGSGPKQEL